MEVTSTNVCLNKKEIFFFCFIIITILLTAQPSKAIINNPWEILYQPRQRLVKSIACNKEKIFIGTGNGILVSSDNGKNWEDFGTESLQKDESGNSLINWIEINENKNIIYAATSLGLYFSKTNSPDWNLIFKDTKNDSSIINSFTLDKNKIYILTNNGILECKQACTRLNQGIKPDPLSSNHLTYFLLKQGQDSILAASNGIYKFDKKNKSWIDFSEGIQKLPDGRINAKHLLTINENTILATTGTGIYSRNLDDKEWTKFSEGIKENLEGFQEVLYLYKNVDIIYAATANGIFLLEENKWIDISDGLRNFNGLKTVFWIKEHNGKLYTATNEGLFTKDIEGSTNKIVLKGRIETDYESLERNEPNVIEVQKQALDFASLPTSNDYKRYRLQARLRNLVPRVGFDLNSNDSTLGYYQLEKGISSESSSSNSFDANKTIRSQTDGINDMRLSVLWNTNSLIYDDEIKEILNQARLTANIRENILDDVTRLYFQRRKLQLESYVSPPETPEEKLSNDLEIASLTGQLDSRTGGWFSKEIEKRKINGIKK